MESLLNMLETKEMTLIVSLPANTMEVARAAINGGADAIKIHINVEHRASGNTFGTVADNLDFFKQLKEEFSGPLGVVVGGDISDVLESEVKQMEDLGFSFFSVYMKDMPAFLIDSSLEHTVAGSEEMDLSLLKYLKDTSIRAFEASIIPKDGYGQPLNFHDLLNYRAIVDNVGMPVIVPSQRRIVPRDMKALTDTGVKGLMIGAMSTGTEAESIEEATRSFREEIDKLT